MIGEVASPRGGRDAHGPQLGGPGLGLALVKRFVELHGGSVEIDSREGHGTAVTIILPENP